jgi:F-type H+-transporting ATPase subunit gamma
MSKRRDLETRLRSLKEIKEIMNAMKNLSLMEVHRLTRFLDTQRRVVANIEAAAADFMSFYPQLLPAAKEFRDIRLLVGSERGFCGDFNESLLRALDSDRNLAGKTSLIVIGGRLAAKLTDDPRVAASIEGPSVVDEVDVALLKLMNALTSLRIPGTVWPLQLTIFHHRAEEASVKVSVLHPFQRPASASERFNDAPRLYLKPQSFLTGLAEQYLFAALHELLSSSLMAENQRRIQHMDAAVRRLEQTSADFLRRRNILRQEEITEEIEIIMLSAEALE